MGSGVLEDHGVVRVHDPFRAVHFRLGTLPDKTCPSCASSSDVKRYFETGSWILEWPLPSVVFGTLNCSSCLFFFVVAVVVMILVVVVVVVVAVAAVAAVVAVVAVVAAAAAGLVCLFVCLSVCVFVCL